MSIDTIQLNSNLCAACWECVEICPNNKIGKIDLPWHKHSKIIKSKNCSGCMQCIKACKYGALSLNQSKPLNVANSSASKRKNIIKSLVVNISLIIFACIMALSGLIIQFNYHIGHHGEIDKNIKALGLDYTNWANLHKISIVFVLTFLGFHIYKNINWFKSILKKGLKKGNKQTFWLSIIFVITAITGILPWIIDTANSDYIFRKLLIEIHDKIALILTILLLIHILQRIKRIVLSFKKL